ncbi:MAG: hypothetical protein IID01_10675 [Chloroflexi bacterium]|nr:hypothetical protein [Chloroflexota bacterium]
MLDFSREKDGSFTENTPNLPLTNFAYDCLKRSRPDDWRAAFIEALPYAPLEVCDHLAQHLLEDGFSLEQFDPLVKKILATPLKCDEALLWLWDGPKREDEVAHVPLLTLLMRVLGVLGELRRDDTVMVAAVFSLYVGSWGALVGAERLGATCFPFGSGAPGQTERAVEWATMVKPSVLYGTPSYALYLAETARQMGFDPKEDFGFRFMFFSGEPGASVPATRRLIEETFGCYIVDQGTMAEMTPWMSASGCRHLDGGMHLWQDIVYTEMVDPQTKLNLPLGEEGVPVYSHTERTSQPMIRYWSGDIARWDMVDCPCGRTYPTLVAGIYGRVDDMIIVRGQNVFPSRIEDVLRSMDEFGGEFRLVLEREPGQMDRLTVQAEVLASAFASREFDPAALEPVRERFTAELRRAIGVSVTVELKPQGEFERTQFKARRVIDLRKP